MYRNDAQVIPSVVVSGAKLLQAARLCGRRATRAGNIDFSRLLVRERMV